MTTHKRVLTLLEPQSHMWGQTTLISSSLSPKRDCGSKGVKRGAPENSTRTTIVASIRMGLVISVGTDTYNCPKEVKPSKRAVGSVVIWLSAMTLGTERAWRQRRRGSEANTRASMSCRPCQGQRVSIRGGSGSRADSHRSFSDMP